MNNLTSHEAKQYSPLSLAFLGDAVYELWIRNKLVSNANRQPSKLNKDKVSYSCAEFQSSVSDKLLKILTDDELAVFRRGKNAKGITPPKHATLLEYKKATGFEAVLGYLYLCGNEKRIDEILSFIWDIK